ncbi:type VI secretion system amidase immunity protein Tai4 [Ralstonia pseudosolanacearum]
MMGARACLFVAALCSSLTAVAADSITAIRRTNAENYKDRALAACLSAAYPGSEAGADSDATKSVFLEWTYYDEDRGNRATDRLVERYLRRDYRNPTQGYAGAQFKLLKCLDLYHSPELDAQVRQFVPHPNWVGDKPKQK